MRSVQFQAAGGAIGRPQKFSIEDGLDRFHVRNGRAIRGGTRSAGESDLEGKAVNFLKRINVRDQL